MFHLKITYSFSIFEEQRQRWRGKVSSPTWENWHKGPESHCRHRSSVCLAVPCDAADISQNILSILTPYAKVLEIRKFWWGRKWNWYNHVSLPMERLVIIIQCWKTLVKLLVFVCSGVMIHDMDFVLNPLLQFFYVGWGIKIRTTKLCRHVLKYQYD